MPFNIVRNDITKMKVDAVVNAANTDLLMGGGVCGAIFNAAGSDELQDACDRLSPIKTGEAVLTPGFKLMAKYVIHAAGPVYYQYSPEESEEYLKNAYKNSLELAIENNCKSIAFPLISSGIYGYPKQDALKVASSVIQEFIKDHDIDVFLAIFDKEAFSVSEELLGKVDSYIDENYVETHLNLNRFGSTNINRPLNENIRSYKREPRKILKSDKPQQNKTIREISQKEEMDLERHISCELSFESDCPISYDELFGLDESFSETLVRLINAKEMTNVEVYKKANIDRKLFSKILTGNGYMPSKRTVVALAIALELDVYEAEDFLNQAGFALSPGLMFDVIVKFFFENKRYDIFEINEVLFKHDQALLGA